MNKANVIKELDQLIGEMEPFFRYLKQGYVKALQNERSVDDYRTLRALLKWLTKVYRQEYAQIKYAWELVPPEMWEGYKLQRIKGLQEQEILANAIKEWRLIWSKRYVDEAVEVLPAVPDQRVGHELQDHGRQDDGVSPGSVPGAGCGVPPAP